MYFSLLIYFVALAAATPTPIQGPQKKRELNDGKLPSTYVAFGDSYSAGIGAGKFNTGSLDQRDNECARTYGAYPKQLQNGKTPSLFDFSMPLWTDFYSCTGDLLSAVSGQVDAAKGKKYEVATLSIGGNDFFFGAIARNCIYKFAVFDDGTASKECDDYLDRVRQMLQKEIENGEFKKTYQDALKKIYSDVLIDDGLLVVTGYSKFFSAELAPNDLCDNLRTTWAPLGLTSRIPLKSLNRQKMNDMVDDVNRMIKEEIIPGVNNPNIRFVDIDPVFNGHRFCERSNTQDPLGANDPKVWFIELNTTPEETADYNPPTGLMDRDGIDFGTLGGALPSSLQKMSSFHPKYDALKVISDRVGWEVLRWSEGRNLLADPSIKKWKWGPAEICLGFSPGGAPTCYDVPANCGSVIPISNTIPYLYCQDSSGNAQAKA